MNTVTLRTSFTSEMLSQLCRDYSQSFSSRCPSGSFICPFKLQTDNGTWILLKNCNEVTPSDWESIVNKKQ